MKVNKLSIKIFAPAKINLFLEILNLRNDGYHNVNMLMQSVNFCDELIISKSFDGKIKVTCDKNLDCSEKDNIVYKLSKKFFEYTGIKNPGVHIDIKKTIPEKAGLAGGSSDGAATLVGLNKIFEMSLPTEALCAIAEEVGSDIPFCVVGGSALATGIGTEISKIDSKLNFWTVIVKPPVDVSTKEAYELIDKCRSYDLKNVTEVLDALKQGDLKALCKNLFNRFEENIQEKEIGKIKKLLLDNGSLGACMSGSGPSVYGIFTSFEDAKLCEKVMKKYYKNVFVCSTIHCGAFLDKNL